MFAFLRSERLITLRVSLAAAFLILLAVTEVLPPLRKDWQQWMAVRSRPDPIGDQDRAYRSLSPWLPLRGRIGYRQPADWGSIDAVRRFFLAEYALTPRVIVLDTAPEFVIATGGALTDVEKGAVISPEQDPQLAGFVLYATADSGLKIFRRQR